MKNRIIRKQSASSSSFDEEKYIPQKTKQKFIDNDNENLINDDLPINDIKNVKEIIFISNDLKMMEGYQLTAHQFIDVTKFNLYNMTKNENFEEKKSKDFYSKFLQEEINQIYQSSDKLYLAIQSNRQDSSMFIGNSVKKDPIVIILKEITPVLILMKLLFNTSLKNISNHNNQENYNMNTFNTNSNFFNLNLNENDSENNNKKTIEFRFIDFSQIVENYTDLVENYNSTCKNFENFTENLVNVNSVTSLLKFLEQNENMSGFFNIKQIADIHEEESKIFNV
jgi:hypothetical protein